MSAYGRFSSFSSARGVVAGALLAAAAIATAAGLLVLIRERDDGRSPSTEIPRASDTIAFVRGKQEISSDIYVARKDGSDLRRLTRGPGFKYDPDWSPDGRWLLYRYEPPGPTASTPEQIGLVVMRADGTEAVDIAARARVYSGPASWAPSHDRIAFAGGRPGEPSSIYVIRRDGSHLRRLTPMGREAQYPAWSPDGKAIAFTYVEPGGGFSIYRVPASGGQVERLTAGRQDNWPAWSPDSSRIAFSRGDSIWTIAADGSDARLVTSRGGAPLNWSPSAEVVFACPGRGGSVRSCAIAPDGSGFWRLLGGAEGGFPAWRPAPAPRSQR